MISISISSSSMVARPSAPPLLGSMRFALSSCTPPGLYFQVSNGYRSRTRMHNLLVSGFIMNRSAAERGGGSHQVKGAFERITQDAVRLVDTRRLLLRVLLLCLHGDGASFEVRWLAELESYEDTIECDISLCDADGNRSCTKAKTLVFTAMGGVAGSL